MTTTTMTRRTVTAMERCRRRRTGSTSTPAMTSVQGRCCALSPPRLLFVVLLLLVVSAPQSATAFVIRVGSSTTGTKQRPHRNHAMLTPRSVVVAAQQQQQQQQVDDASLMTKLQEEWDADNDIEIDDATYADYEAQLQALATQRRRGRSSKSKDTNSQQDIVDDAMAIFDRMLKAYILQENASLWPDTNIYNLILAVHVTAAAATESSRSVVLDQACTIVQRMRDADTTGAARPNAVTYARLMDMHTATAVAAAASKEEDDTNSNKSQTLRDVQALYDEYTGQNIDSDNNNNRKVLDEAILWERLVHAHGKLDGGAAAVALLNDRLLDNNGDDTVMITIEAWVQVMKAIEASECHSRDNDDGDNESKETQGKTGLQQLHALLDRLVDHWSSNYGAHSDHDGRSLVKAFGVVLRNESRWGHAKEAEALLYRLITLSLSSPSSSDGTTPSMPDTRCFYHVYTAYQRCHDTRGIAFAVEKLLAMQDALAAQQQQSRDKATTLSTTDVIAPNARTLTAALAAMARDGTDPRKAVKAKRVFDRLSSSNDNSGPSPYACKQLMHACLRTPCLTKAASNVVATPRDKLDAFQIALSVYNHPSTVDRKSSTLYGQMLLAVANLIPETAAKRDDVTDAVFGACCEAGLVDESVLEYFSLAASNELVLRHLGGFFEDGVQPPDAWSCNVVDRE